MRLLRECVGVGVGVGVGVQMVTKKNQTNTENQQHEIQKTNTNICKLLLAQLLHTFAPERSLGVLDLDLG